MKMRRNGFWNRGKCFRRKGTSSVGVAFAASLHQFVTLQHNDAIATKQWSVTVPGHARGSALVIDCAFWTQAQFGYFRETAADIA
jgi:hypothetical protein